MNPRHNKQIFPVPWHFVKSRFHYTVSLFAKFRVRLAWLRSKRLLRRQASSLGGYSHTLPIRVCAAQRGRDFEAPDLERGIHFRGVF